MELKNVYSFALLWPYFLVMLGTSSFLARHGLYRKKTANLLPVAGNELVPSNTKHTASDFIYHLIVLSKKNSFKVIYMFTGNDS